MKIKLRLLFRSAVADSHGVYVAHRHKTDVFEVPPNCKALDFDVVTSEGDDWLPEVIGGEWILEQEAES